MPSKKLPDTRRGIDIVFNMQIQHMNLANRPHNLPTGDELWQMRVEEAALLLLRTISETESNSGCKIPYQDSGWPEMLVSYIKERFENFDEVIEERYIKSIEKELDK